MSTKLMLGGNVFGHFTNAQETKNILRCAFDLNIRAIDTSDTYSEGLSEELIGKVLSCNREAWFIASKVGLQSHASPNGLGRRATILKKVEGSLRRLQTDYLDLYQMHHFDPITPLEETLETLELLQNQGKIKMAGISNYSLEQLQQLCACPSLPVHYNQIALNLQNFQCVEEEVRLSQAMKLELLAYSPLARGLLTEKYLKGTVPKTSRASVSLSIKSCLTPAYYAKIKRMHLLCQKTNLSILDLALNFLNQMSSVAYILVGIRRLEDLFSCHQALLKSCDADSLLQAQQIWSS